MNELIKSVREVALGILKPSQKDLEHGLELHQQAIVCESYGFTPRSAIDGDAMRAAVEAGASPQELQDMTEDMYMTRHVTDPTEQKEFMEAWEASGITCVFQNAGEETQDPLQAMKRLARYTYASDNMPHFLLRATRVADIERAKAQGLRCMVMTTNAVPLPQRWLSLEEELSYIRIFHQLGVRMMHLTYNRRNMIGDGCAESANAGLSDFGRAVVTEMNNVGVIVDVAHSGWQTSLEAAQTSSRPMVASHSGVAALNDHIRCKPDEVIKAICDTGGYVGICCVPSFLGGTGDIRAFLNHIDYIVKNFGADHVAIGTDLAWISRQMSPEQKKVPARPRGRQRWENFWPAGSKANLAQQSFQSMAWTNWPLFTVGMVQRGYSDEMIRKIIGGNVLRVARSAERV